MPANVTTAQKARVLVCSHRESPARQWDISTGKPIQAFKRAEWDLTCALSPDGKTLLTGSAFGRTAQFWDTTTGQPKGPPLPHTYGGHGALAFSADGRTAVTGGDDLSVRLWDVATCQPLGPPRQLGSVCDMVAFTHDEKWIIANGAVGTRIWEVPTPVEGTITEVRAAIGQLIGSAAVNQ